MSNNDVFKKLRVALMLRDDDIVEILKLADFKISKTELSAFFRKEDHPNFVACGDQILRNFLNGLVIYLRGTKEHPKYPGDVISKDKKGVKTPLKRNKTLKPSFKSQQQHRMEKEVSPVRYKNKKKS
ncbi:MAG: DUF1456 family protein [Flavobacteriales bacterium]|nr:MAG: DUF1456 family protein [Flavobacteriales bacterium]